MNAPMVVVQGDLLLPTLYPLAGMPNAVYGEERTLIRARPALTEYEIPFYAARLLTAYINALLLRDDRFPYTPTSLWGKFKRIEEVNHAEPRVSAPPIPDTLPPQASEPAPFAFEPDDWHVKTSAAITTIIVSKLLVARLHLLAPRLSRGRCSVRKLAIRMSKRKSLK